MVCIFDSVGYSINTVDMKRLINYYFSSSDTYNTEFQSERAVPFVFEHFDILYLIFLDISFDVIHVINILVFIDAIQFFFVLFLM